MKVQCPYCSRVLDFEIRPFEDKRTTHRICAVCLIDVQEMVKQLRANPTIPVVLPKTRAGFARRDILTPGRTSEDRSSN